MTTITDPTHAQLDSLMDFGHVVGVTILPHGHVSVSDAFTPTADYRPPESFTVYGEDPDDAQIKAQLPPGWVFVTGYTGQDGYHGPVMHNSEFIGGSLANAILAHGGFYVTSYIDHYSDEPETDGEEPYTEGWVLAYFGPDIV